MKLIVSRLNFSFLLSNETNSEK